MDPVVAWHEEHVYFHQLLQLLQEQLDRFHRGETLNYELVQDIVSYLHENADLFHHPREDVAFACLARRCPDLQLTLARLAQEHRVIASAGAALQALIRAILDGALIPRAEVEAAAATFLVYYGNHIAREEEDVLPRAAKELTPEDWSAVRNSVHSGPDPLFGDNPHERYRELRRQIARQA